jgi:hypothetical protein
MFACFTLDLLPVSMNDLMILGSLTVRHADCLFHPEAVLAMGFIPSEADPKLCISLQTAKKDCQQYTTQSLHVTQFLISTYTLLLL